MLWLAAPRAAAEPAVPQAVWQLCLSSWRIGTSGCASASALHNAGRNTGVDVQICQWHRVIATSTG
jgi:hypothetical protein